MHEVSLCERIVQILEQEARNQAFSRVNLVRLEIGALAGVEVEAMRFGFDVVTRGTLAEDANLEIIHQPAIAWCLQCSKRVGIQQRYDPCPDCGLFQLQVIQGDDMRIKDLEVE